MKAPANEKYVKEIITDYDMLSIRCSEFDMKKNNKDVQKIVLELKNTIRHNNLAALSANQIGYGGRMICMNFNGDIRTFINPIITNVKGLELSREYCSSIPDKGYIRLRHTNVDITYQTPLGKIESIELVGMAARLMQHHMDHLDGLLLSDIGLEVDEEFDNASEEERQEVISAYLDALDLANVNIEKDIETDEEAQKILDASRFLESVQKGETVLEPVDEEETTQEE